MDSTGNLFGTANAAFELSPGVGGWRETLLHDFTGQHGDGFGPYAGLILDAAGNLYGQTEMGGSDRCGGGCGTVYQLTPKSDGKWKENILHRFQARWDGSSPVGALLLDGAGNLYGTAGGGNAAHGVVFRLSRGTDGRWREAVVYNIPGGANGDQPGGGVVMDKAGNLYGTTVAGGDPNCDCGVVFKLALGSNGSRCSGWVASRHRLGRSQVQGAARFHRRQGRSGCGVVFCSTRRAMSTAQPSRADPRGKAVRSSSYHVNRTELGPRQCCATSAACPTVPTEVVLRQA